MYTHQLFISTFSSVSLARICIYSDFASIGHTYFPFYTAQFSRAYALIFQNYHGLDDEKVLEYLIWISKGYKIVDKHR